MKQKTLFSTLFATALALLILVPVFAIPPQPAGFYGYVTVDGSPVPDGTAVVFAIGGVPYVQTTTSTYQGQSAYSLDVPGDDPDTAPVEGGQNGDLITITVAGQTAAETAVWQEGSNNALDLTATSGGTLQADFTCTPLTGMAPLAVTCTDASTGAVASWNWDFGDGGSSANQNPTHTFTAAGVYTVTLTASDGSSSDTHTRAGYVQVQNAAGGQQRQVTIPLVSGGSLSVTPQDVIFPQTALGGIDTLLYAFDTNWVAEDTTQLGAGWHVTILALDHLRGSQDPTNRVLTVGTNGEFKVDCNDADIQPLQGGTTSPFCAVGLQPVPITGEAPLTLLSAAANTGMGSFQFVPHFQMLVPGSTVIDTYTTSVHIDIIAGP